jgi:hypothetical protein
MFDDQLPAFAGWTIPEGYTADNVGRCRSCGAEILWCLTKTGARSPHDRDGVSHFATCPQSKSWRRRA